MKKNIKRFEISIFLIILTVFLTIFIFIALFFYSNLDIVMTINKEIITKEEYQMILKEYTAKVKSNFSTDQVNKSDFWNSNFNGISPLDQIMNFAEKELKEKKILSEIAKEKKISVTTDYKELKNESTKHNFDNKYGLNNFTVENYYRYTYYNLENLIREELKKDFNISDNLIEETYLKNKEVYSYDTYVKMLVAEFKEEESLNKEIIDELSVTSNINELKSKFSNVDFYEIEMNSLDTKEGKSGVYENRWLIASKMRKNDISDPFKIENKTLIMKCIDRSEQGTIDFKEIKGTLKSQLLDIEVDNYINEKLNAAKVKFNKKKLKKIAIETLE